MSVLLNEIEFPLRIRTANAMSDVEFARFCAANEPTRFERDANGELIVMSPTFTEGGNVELNVGTELNIWARQDGRGKALGPNSGVTLPDGSVRAADAAWVSWLRWNALTLERRSGFVQVCPEFVIEVRSETDRLKPLQEKMEMWIGNGAELAWLIDPVEKTVSIYRLGEAAEMLCDPSSVRGTGVVAGFELAMARIWG
jgi:Uma2 family endonuclease